jgi:excinuclease ABC subunit B
VILYADKVTDAMRNAIDETRRRRELQERYNAEHGITPETVKKNIRAGIESAISAHRQANAAVGRKEEAEFITDEYLSELEAEMMAAADAMEFERAAVLRDRILQLKKAVGEKMDEVEIRPYQPQGKRRRRGAGGAKVPRPKKRM